MASFKYGKYIENNTKLNLSYNGLMVLNEIYEIFNEDELKNDNNKKIINPFYELINNKDNITSILKGRDLNVLEYLYLNRHKIHQILYDSDSTITINEEMLKEYTDYYYLYCLIKYQSVLINFKYNFQIVQDAYDKQIISKGIIKRIIMSKIVITIIDNFLEEEEDNEIIDKCTNIKTKCIEYINNNKQELNKYQKDLDLDNLEKSDVFIEDIYSDIIYTLIINNKLNQSEEILNELEIKKIRLNKSIFDSINNAFSEENINNYEISEYNDFFKLDKINFYFILFEYILKCSDYIIYIPFLSKMKEKILQKVKENLEDLYNYFEFNRKKNDNSITKLKQVLNYFIELNYYLEKAKAEKKQNAKPSQIESNNSSMANSQMSYNLSEYSSSMYNSSKYGFENSSFKNRNNNNLNSYSNYEISEKSISELKKDKAFNILSDSNFVVMLEYKQGRNKANIEYKKISYKDESNNTCELTLEELKNIVSEDSDLNSKFGQFIILLDKIESELISQYKRNKKTEINLHFKMENYNNYYINVLYNINDDDINEKEFIDENILDNNFTGLTYMINELQ